MQDGKSISKSILLSINRKIRNRIVQTVAAFKFYQLTNKALTYILNQQFTALTTNTTLNYPYDLEATGINIHYPHEQQLNNTLGVKLLSETSKLQQLKTQLTTLKGYINTYQDHLTNYSSLKATLQGSIASR